MGAATLVTGLQNWLYLKKELMKLIDFLHDNTNLGKLKVTVTIIRYAWSKTAVVIYIMRL